MLLTLPSVPLYLNLATSVVTILPLTVSSNVGHAEWRTSVPRAPKKELAVAQEMLQASEKKAKIWLAPQTTKFLILPVSQPLGFEEEFGTEDFESDYVDDEYDGNKHPVWEYDVGGPGNPKWIRYPAQIEQSLENLCLLGSPRYMYRPGCPDADGTSVRELLIRPPRNVATQYVYYCDMLEREIYTGAARSVQRNG